MEAPRLDTLVAAAMPKQPYPGLRPFEPEEWSIFFGREAMIDEVIERLGLHRVVLIHGASGSGKSSLVRAGVLPKLARQHLRHGTPWVTCAMRPSGGPLWNLAREFARIEGRERDLARIGQIIRLFNRQGATLASVVGSLEGLAGRRLCILVDQFEELFRFERETSREEAEVFVDLIIGAIDAGTPEGEAAQDTGGDGDGSTPADGIHIAITMRSEFLGDCARFDGFAEAINRTQYLVPRMTREALTRAIRRPAQLYGGEVTADLAERLIADVRGKEDELPLIQHGLMLLWHTAAAAGPNGPIKLDVKQLDMTGGLTKLLSDHADRIMAAAEPFAGETNAIERLFRALTDINADGRAIRRPQTFHDLVELCRIPADDLRAILDAFRMDGVSFLTPYFPAPIEDKTVIDISHEALIRCWKKIADPQTGWLRDEFQDGLIWRSLLIEAKAFQTNKKHVLSPAATRQRTNWVAQRSAPWSERYGGGWDLVEDLLQASRRSATRFRRVQRFAVLLLVFAAVAGVVGWMQNAKFSQTAKNPAIVLMLLALFGATVVIVLIGIDYLRQLVPSRIHRAAIVLVLFAAGMSILALDYMDLIPGRIELRLFFMFTAIVAAVWILSQIVRAATWGYAWSKHYFGKRRAAQRRIVKAVN